MIEVQTMLLLVKSPQDNDLQITFDVTATANVREYVGGDCEPGEFLIEDIEINDVRSMSISYGRFGAQWVRDSIRFSDTPFQDSRVIYLEAHRRLEWLNATLRDRDDWTEAIRIAATSEHMRRRDQIRN